MSDNQELFNNIDEIRGKLIISISGEDEILSYQTMGLTFESTEAEILEAVRPMIQEKYHVDLRDTDGDWLYKVRKAVTKQNIHLIPNSTAGEDSLPYLDDNERMKIYNLLSNGCQHLWSKGKLQDEKMSSVLNDFAVLAERDPLFLARFTSYVYKKSDSKDLKVVSLFANSLSDADGTPFSLHSEFKKPNWRIISQAAFCELDPKLALRVLKLANTKKAFGSKQAGTHFSRHLKTAARKYLKYREANSKALEGAKKAGLGNTIRSLYRIARIAPSPEACQILRWKQKSGYPGADIEIKKSTMFDFSGMSDLQIAEKIRKEKLKPQPVVGALPDKISPVVAAAILEQCSGDQAVILTSLFEDQGLLKNKEVLSVYNDRIKGAKNALDRVDRIKKDLDESTREILKQTKADVRKEQVGDIGRVFLHIDISGSMHDAIRVAIDKGAIIAECVKDPEKNFFWGAFNQDEYQLKLPQKFTKDGFAAALYGLRPDGMTNCFACYQRARQLDCDTDIFVTDGQHTQGVAALALEYAIKLSHDKRPKNAVIIKCGTYTNHLEEGLRANKIPYSVISAEQLSESALVAQSIRTAVLGKIAIVEDILKTPFLELPKWWGSVN